ncbi:hypothetical protein KUTeg_006618 [Tegillarca granosa]|uniref:BIR protein n=1 Tax=Tegillarca granosa TaxID=220873 RepID=A0ABQ9FAU6_TEGGR|nr:hypothetical protein KUTeg_006618 [Tegillarca granosa]
MIQADGDNHQTVIQTVADEMLREDDEKTIQLYLEETIIYIYQLYSFVQNIIENGALAFMRTRFVLYIYNQLKKQKNEENLNKYKSQYKKQEEKCEQDKINPAHSNNKQNESEEMSIENDKKRNMGNDANSYAVRTNNRINTDGDADLAQGIKYTTDNVPGKVKNLKEERNGENFNKYQYEEKQPREKSGGMKSICKLPGTILLRKHENEKTCNAALAENSKPLVLVILDTETLRQSLDDFFESDQNKKIIGVIMQLLTHGYGRFRQSRLSLLPLTHTEMNKFLDMNIDLNRLSTFTDWPNKSISSLHLAKAGFIYMGEGQEVSCFSCGLTISKFPEEFTPLDFHRTNGNNCNFLQSLDMNNNILNNSANEVQRNDKTQSQLKNTNSRTDQSRNDANKDLDSILTTDISDMGYQNGFVASNNMQPTIDKHTGNDGRSLKDSGSVLKNNLIKNETNNEVINYENRHENNSLTWSVDNYTNLNDNILGSAKHRQFIGIRKPLSIF